MEKSGKFVNGGVEKFWVGVGFVEEQFTFWGRKTFSGVTLSPPDLRNLFPLFFLQILLSIGQFWKIWNGEAERAWVLSGNSEGAVLGRKIAPCIDFFSRSKESLLPFH